MSTIILIMGVAGSGKSTLGAALAASLGWEFIEADRYHPSSNIEKMAAGIPLTDDDRQPWLRALRAAIDERLLAGRSAILACSALRESYRAILRDGIEDRVPIVYLRADPEVLKQRLASRRGHYMGPGMLESQLETLEEPRNAIEIALETPPEDAVATIHRRLGL